LEGGTKFFSNENIAALIIGLNGSGFSFGIGDIEVHRIKQSFGFHPISYDPYSRKVLSLNSYNVSANTIYVKRIELSQQRVKNSKSVRNRTA